MRIILLLAILGIIPRVYAQNCDIATTGVGIYNGTGTSPIASIPAGQQANFRFSLSNFGTDLGCEIPANTVTAIFDFPTLSGGIKPYKYDGPLTFTSGYFTWNYIASEEVLEGTNTMAIPNGLGDLNILVKVKGNSPGTASSNLNLTQGGGTSDNIGNNFSSAQLIISAAGPLPVKLSSFTAIADKCDVSLKWSTSSEANFSHFEVEYSTDGIRFNRIGTIQGKDIATGADYQFTYTQPGSKGYYRLKQVDEDQRTVYSNTINISTGCALGRVQIYPNPLMYDQTLYVNVSGFSGSIAGELFNATGQKVKAYTLFNMSNELSVKNLSAGTYMLFVKNDSGESQSFKIIITR